MITVVIISCLESMTHNPHPHPQYSGLMLNLTWMIWLSIVNFLYLTILFRSRVRATKFPMKIKNKAQLNWIRRYLLQGRLYLVESELHIILVLRLLYFM